MMPIMPDGGVIMPIAGMKYRNSGHRGEKKSASEEALYADRGA
jgi:hypothetical protein